MTGPWSRSSTPEATVALRPPPEPAREEAPVPVEFDGRAGEWFGIWIVNLLLTVVTLGIYSAWAKVRRKKYFNQHTRIAGRSFDYHATGQQILIGRLVVLAGFILYSVLAAVPALAVVMPILLLALIPFLLVRALRFNARMTSWANVRFGFDGKAGSAFVVYLLYPGLAALSLYTLWPFASRAIRRFSIGHHRLGSAPFAFESGIGPFYRAFAAAVVAFAVLALLFGALLDAILGPAELNPATGEPASFVALLPLASFAALLLAVPIYNAFLRNAVFAATRVDGVHRLRSDIVPLRLVWIHLSNAVATVLSLGMLLPWAQIRVALYLAAHTAVIPGGSLDEFVGEQQAAAGPLGDAFSDLGDWDVGLPI